MRVLIVGCGYVGLPLGAALAKEGHEVTGIRRTHSAQNELRAAGVEPLIADITEAEALAKLPVGYDWVVNCVSSSHGGADDYRRVYLHGMRNLVEWLAAAPIRKFVYTSSTSVYGQTDGSIVTEASAAEPPGETPQILVEAENALLEAAQQREFPAVILRVAGIYGPERGHWFKQYLRGEAVIEGQGERILNMIHRDDVVGAIIVALKSGRPGEIYNAADDEPVTQLKFFQWLSTRLRRDLPPYEIEHQESARKRAATNKRVSNLKLKRELGYCFKYPDFRQGYEGEIRLKP